MPGQEVGCRLPGLSIGWDINQPKVSQSWMQGLTAREETGRRGQPRAASMDVGLGSSHLRGCWVCHRGYDP